VYIYVNDILIFRDALEELEYWMQKVLQTMWEGKLSCKLVKCQFEKMTVKYLGIYLTHGQIAVNPSKVTVITNWPVPQKLKDIKSFLSTINFWCKFIKNFSLITHPLHELKKKDAPFVWANSQQQAFDALKQAIMSTPILKIPQDLPYLLKTDA
jgi:hypothetical protein